MKTFQHKTLSSLFLTASIFQSGMSWAQPNVDKPNIIFLLVDDLRWDAMGFTGQYPFLKTPNIDRLRAEGVHFQNAFCTHSLCAPSRATILTGMFPQTNGVSTNQEGREYNPDKTPSFAQILQENNYKTGFVGKWHMAESNSPRKGFDYWCSFSGQGNYNGNNLNINGQMVRNEGYVTDELNKYALEFIDANSDQPFCIYLSHKAVHQPFTPPERDAGLYENDLVPEPAGWSDNMETKPAWQRVEANMEQRLRIRDKDLNQIHPVKTRKINPWPAKTGKGEQKNYLRCMSAVDKGLGQIVDLLRKKGILDQTVIVFAGDNGFFHGEHGKGDKRLAYNESMRIPLVMRYPKVAKAGQSVSEMVLNADLAPTFLDLAGVKIPGQMQGKSIIPLLQGHNEGWRTSFLFTYWPDLIYFLPRITAVRTEKYLYSQTPDLADIDELYDLQNDPAEMVNLSENPQFAPLKKQLAAELEALKKETGYRVEVPRPDAEPVGSVQTGLVFSLDFEKETFHQTADKIKLLGVKPFTENGKVVGSFANGASAVIANHPDLDPSVGTFIIDCIIKPTSPNGVIASAGSQKDGWAIFIENGIPGLVVSHGAHLQFVDGLEKITGKWTHLVAVIENYHNHIRLFADGKLIGQRQMLLPISSITENDGDVLIGLDNNKMIDPKVISKYQYEGLIRHFSISRQKKPNVLFIMTDQQRWDAMGCAGNLEIKTPNIDRLAKGGVQFMNAYSSCPVCVPARSSILTGKTIFNVRVLGNGDIDNDDIPDIPTFDQVLSDNGYHTEYYGKWHAPYKFTSKYNNAVNPTNKSKFTDLPGKVEGFRKYLDEIGVIQRPANANEVIDPMSLRPYVPLPIDGRYGIKEVMVAEETNGKKPKREKVSQAQNFGIIHGPENGSLAAYEGNEALEALKRMNPEKSFSLTCSFGPPHPPFIVPKKYADLYNPDLLSVPASINDPLQNAPYQISNSPFDARFQNPEMVQQMKQVYYGMVTQVDEWVGKLLDELDRKGLSENTLVVFVSDHGELMGDHGLNSKMKMYEGSAHIPLIMRMPGIIPAGTKVETPVSHHDLFASILDYTGMKIPENDGRSLRSLIDGKPDGVDYAVSVWGQINNGGPFMIRKGDWKLIVYLQMADNKQKSVGALYNLKSDPHEMNNLIGTNPEKPAYEKVANELKCSLKDWMIKTKTPYVSELENVHL